MKRPHADHDAWVRAIMGPPAQSPLQLGDFKHVGAAVDLAVGILRGARQAAPAGLNILLYGPVGTGKTELAKVLAEASGSPIWSICEEDEDGDEPDRRERLASLRLVQRLLSTRESSVILVDEADDILASPRGCEICVRGSFKVYLNRQLENATRPVIWTCNDLGDLDPAVLRRMTLAIEVKRPGAPVREAGDLLSGKPMVGGDAVEEFWALRNLDFQIKPGEVVGVLGRNGAGKSTLLKILSRITEPSEGRVTIRLSGLAVAVLALSLVQRYGALAIVGYGLTLAALAVLALTGGVIFAALSHLRL